MIVWIGRDSALGKERAIQSKRSCKRAKCVAKQWLVQIGFKLIFEGFQMQNTRIESAKKAINAKTSKRNLPVTLKDLSPEGQRRHLNPLSWEEAYKLMGRCYAQEEPSKEPNKA